ncbi:hypothetical protein K7432_013241 [Basidiobolus ranarum]|uniref:Uncharacterized protein n=1 Tax=Basidiobolus ranarum TaxID=34480 RepID=A0ABR2WJI6_9FUNG
MRFILALLVVLCAIFSAIAAPLPLDATVNVNTDSTGTSPAPVSCGDINAKIDVLTVKISTVICLKSDQELPTDMVANSDTQCSPDIQAHVDALGLKIRAIVCLKDGIKVAVNVQ